MGFDAIDRQFRRKEIKLECVQCDSTVNVKPYFFYGQGTVNACEKCIKAYEDEIWAAGF